MDILQADGFLFGQNGGVANGKQFFFVFQLTNLIDTQKTDFSVLRTHDKVDKLYQRPVEHSDNKLRGNHYPKCDIALDYRHGTEKDNAHIFDAFDKLSAQVLCVGYGENTLIDVIEPGLNLFPFPTAIFLIVINLDILNGRNRFYPIALVAGEQFKILPVQFLSDTQKE